MKHLIELKRTIDKSLGLDIVYNEVASNFEWNRIWVTELDGKYFEHKKRLIEDYIDKYIDYNEESEVNLLLDLKNKINCVLLEIEATTYENVFNQEFCKITLHSPLYWPNQSPMEFSEVDPFNLERLELEILEMIKSYHDIELDDLIQDTQGMREALMNGKADNGKIYNEEEVKLIFAKAHLFHILWLHQNTLKHIVNHIKYYFEAINLLKGDISQETQPNLTHTNFPYQLQFNMSKKKVGLFFHTFHQLGWIHGDIENIDNSENMMKKYLDSCNLWYMKNQKLSPVIDIDKEFGNWYRKGDDVSKIKEEEVNYLNSLIATLQERKNQLENKKQEKEIKEKNKFQRGRF